MASSDEEQDYDDTVDENEYLYDVSKKYSNVRAFLSRNERIYARSVQMNSCSASVWLKYQSDIDGCVVELSNICGLQLPIHQIELCPYDSGSLKSLKGVLKKHVDLKQFSRAALSNFNDSVGIQLFFEKGWYCWLGLLPKTRTNEMSREMIRQLGLKTFQSLRTMMGVKLLEYAAAGVALQTIVKNDLSRLKKLFVLPGDVVDILKALESAWSSLEMKYFEPICFCFRFGEKMRDGISLADFHLNSIKKVTVHAAIDMSSTIPGIELLWSMEGVQEVVGDRGTLSTCLSFSDCANFTSNLDGRYVDVKGELLRLFVKPDKVTYVQLYADTPHLKPNSRFHPVSGLVAGGLCFPHKTLEAFQRDAARYVCVLKQDFCLLQSSSCRLEIVGEVTPSSFIKPGDCIDEDALDLLVQTRSMVVPLPSESLKYVGEIGLWLCSELQDLLASYSKTGNLNATWQAFQYELACEKILWGRPLCWQSAGHSVNLGPGQLSASRSLTDHLGFIALEPHTACMHTEKSLPPTRIWTASEAVGKSIVRSCGMHDHLDASNPVLGRHLILALLADFYDLGKVGGLFRFADFLSALKSGEPNRLHVVGAITVDSLVELLTQPRRNQLHMVFGSLLKMLVRHQLSPQDLVAAGLRDLCLKRFPAFQTWDTHRNATLTWSVKNSFWKLEDISNSTVHQVCGSPDVYSRLACCDLERRGLIFPSKLKKLPVLWPWIEPCLAKLVQERLTEQQLITTLAFVSALALAMSGMFVDYDRLKALHDDCPVKQFRLKILEIQSKLELPKFRFQNLILYRLHPTIPHQIEAQEKAEKLQELEPREEKELDLDSLANNRIVHEEDISIAVDNAESRPSSCVPVGVTRIWTSRELQILHSVRNTEEPRRTVKELYSVFREICFKDKIPVRPFASFKRKWSRIQPDQSGENGSV